MAHDAVPLDERARRFLFRRRIGEGAFGVVWEAYDTERGARVALKALTRTEPGSLYLFKREFRSLADIVHPNLVTLYELLSFGEKWFFTMEFIDGVDFIEHLRGSSEIEKTTRNRGTETVTIMRSGPVVNGELPAELSPEALASSVSVNVLAHAWYDQPTMESTTLNGHALNASVEVRISRPPPAIGSFMIERARPALLQLAEGLTTLHEAGKLHRDIKPSNILVTDAHRVAVLDFGLITELLPSGVQRESNAIVGTPAYMSPEQALGKSLSPASDWYAVGVMLYVALTGRLPFDGSPLQVLIAKQRLDPPAPSTLADDVPEDLEQLCMELLQRKPEDRPTGPEILRRLGATQPASRHRSVDQKLAFVGRTPQLAALREGFLVTQSGRPAAAIIHGPSGLGKTALAQAFVRALRREEPDALILAGRCFPRESVPYKAMDSLIDELSLYLQHLAPSRAAVLMPRSMEALFRIFPVLRQVESAGSQTLRASAIASEVELRRRAFAALRELFGRLAERKPVVLVLDDLQWSDADSDALLAEILRGPDAPPLFVIATFRSENVATTPLAKELRSQNIETRIVRVEPLPYEEARELALRFTGGAELRAAAIARESAGNPFFVEVLADHVTMLRSDDDRSPDSAVRVDLGDVFREKMSRLPEGAKKLLETVAVAGHPIPIIPAWKASEVALPEQAMLSLLLVLHLLRAHTDVGSALEEIEPYHERIRDAVLSGLSAREIRACHERIAIALEAAGDTDCEVLASHFEAAGRMLDAGRNALAAANQSATALAFDRAARLYRWALSLAPSSDDSNILARLGDALANAGRGAEAADAYLAAARSAAPSGALELRRKAAEQLLISGHVERGMEVVRLVMSSLGMKLPVSREAAILSFIASRARLKLRGLSFTERPAASIPAAELLRIDTSWAVAVGLSLVDTIRGTDFQGRHLLLALDAGEPYRITRALAIEVAYAAAGGPKTSARTAELVELSLDLAERIRHPHALGLATTMAGAARYLAGRARDSVDLLERGSQILREQCTGVTWELNTADIFVFSALQQLGRWKELTVRLEDYVRNARARGDLYAETHAMLESNWYVELTRDMPETARENLDRAHRRKKTEGFDMHDYLHVVGLANIDLYTGDPEAALLRVDEAWSRIRGAFLLEIYLIRIECLSLRSRARIACAALPQISSRHRARLLRETEKDIAKLEEDTHLYPVATATLLRAGVASVEHKLDVARDLCERAERAYSSADLEVHAAVARHRLGQLSRGARGTDLMSSAALRLEAQTIKARDKVARLVAPGRWND